MFIFAYGSLMWRPEVLFRARYPALLTGYHRAYLMYSTKGRGSQDAPGMMMGLAPGGSCWGVAYEFESGLAGQALRDVDEREGRGKANWRVLLPIRVVRSGGRETPGGLFQHAWTYMPWPGWENYCGIQPRERMVELIATGVGERGSAFDYLRCVVREMERIGHPDPQCLELLTDVERRRAGMARRTAPI